MKKSVSPKDVEQLDEIARRGLSLYRELDQLHTRARTILESQVGDENHMRAGEVIQDMLLGERSVDDALQLLRISKARR